MCADYGLTGVLARSVGIKKDLRIIKTETYNNYYYLNFKIFLGNNGDCFDRFLIRILEMSESLNIINQAVFKLFKYKKKKISGSRIAYYLNQITLAQHNLEYKSMENLIQHFKK